MSVLHLKPPPLLLSSSPRLNLSSFPPLHPQLTSETSDNHTQDYKERKCNVLLTMGYLKGIVYYFILHTTKTHSLTSPHSFSTGQQWQKQN